MKETWRSRIAQAHRDGQGFTLIELGIVLAIIAILIAVAIPTYNTMIAKAHASEAQQAWSEVESEAWTAYEQASPQAFPTIGSSTSGNCTNFPTGIDCPSSTYWAYAVTEPTGEFEMTATHTGAPTYVFTVNTTGTVTQTQQ